MNNENNHAYTRRCSVPSTGYPFPFREPPAHLSAGTPRHFRRPSLQAGLTSTWECTTRALGAPGNVRLHRKSLAELVM